MSFMPRCDDLIIPAFVNNQLLSLLSLPARTSRPLNLLLNLQEELFHRAGPGLLLGLFINEGLQLPKDVSVTGRMTARLYCQYSAQQSCSSVPRKRGSMPISSIARVPRLVWQL